MSPKIGPKKVKNTIIVHVNDQVVIKYRASTWQVRNAGARFQVSGSRVQVSGSKGRCQVPGVQVPGSSIHKNKFLIDFYTSSGRFRGFLGISLPVKQVILERL